MVIINVAWAVSSVQTPVAVSFGGTGVLVGVKVGVKVGVGVAVFSGVFVGVLVGVRVFSGVLVGVGVFSGVLVGVLVGRLEHEPTVLSVTDERNVVR